MNNRIVSLDLLKITAMFLIVLQHTLDFVGFLSISNFNTKYFPIYFFEAFSIVAVNIFVLITGFFLIKQNFKWQKIFNLLFEIAAFSWIILLISKLFGIQNLSPNTTFNFIFPTYYGLYWFISSYVILYFLFPFINKFIYALNSKQLKTFAIFTFTICCLWKYNFDCKSVFWLITVYFWGACIRLFIYEKKQNFLFLTDKTLHNIIFYILCFITTALSFILFNIKGKQFISIIAFNYLFVFLSSLFLFLAVYKIKFTENLFSKIIVFAAPASLGVYLIHMHPLLSYHISNFLQQVHLPYKWLSLNILFFSLLIFIICFIISLILHKLLTFLSNKILCPNIEKAYNIIKKYLVKNENSIIS